MGNLTTRQIEILRVIITEYTLTGEPVGSEILDKKYNLGVSPATVRNEMIQLAKKGYLKKVHFSSGRIPTPQAFRFYIKNLIKEKELSTAEEVSYKNDIWDFRNEMHHFLQQATKTLAKKTNLLALTTTNLGDIYYFGIPNILSQKEFWDVDLSKDFFSLFDEEPFCQNILNQFKKIEEELLFVLGDEEFEDPKLETSASVFGEFTGNKITGAIGVMGPKRMDYAMVIPNVKYFAHLIEEILKERKL
jgi:heat-inducible transcriptional repressor